MFCLPVDILVIPGESLTNYFIRLAAANFLNITDLITHLRSLHAPPPDVLSESSFPTTWRSAYEQLSTQTTNRTWSCLKPKLCMSCFSEHGKCKECWDLTLNTVCTSHKTLLQNQCQHCASHFTLQTLESKKCARCGASILTSSATHHVACQEAIWLCREFENRLTGIPSNYHASIDRLDVLDFHCVAMCLGQLGYDAESSSAKKCNNLRQIENVYEMTLTAGRLLSDWPTSFHDSLQKLYSGVATLNRNSAARYADRLRASIYGKLASPTFDFIRSEFEGHSFPSKRTPNAVGHHYDNEPVAPKQLTSVTDIAKATNTNIRLLKRLISEGDLHGYRGPSARGNRTIVADLQQAKNLTTTRPLPLNVTQASNQLKLPINTVKVLCKHGFFTCLGGKPTVGQSWWIDTSSFDMSSASIKRQRSHTPNVSLRNILQHPFMSEDGVVCFFRAIQEGMLSVSITGKSSTCVIGDWRLRKDESDNWLSTHMEQVACSESLSVCQVAKYLCTTSDVAYALVRHGLLDSTIEIRNGIASRRVNLHSIEEFRKSYVWGKNSPKLSI
ncbi:hypothetical protein C4K08_4173 [Pseudomonas chlororaphis subsp. aureofaciens]|nr:hypothetical protein C4K08_4173 [Pseudomonas chlororaphis subsp. aureofaciens]